MDWVTRTPARLYLIAFSRNPTKPSSHTHLFRPRSKQASTFLLPGSQVEEGDLGGGPVGRAAPSHLPLLPLSPAA